MIDKVSTIMVKRVASCLEGQVTFRNSAKTSSKKDIGANPLRVNLGGSVDKTISFP